MGANTMQQQQGRLQGGFQGSLPWWEPLCHCGEAANPQRCSGRCCGLGLGENTMDNTSKGALWLMQSKETALLLSPPTVLAVDRRCRNGSGHCLHADPPAALTDTDTWWVFSNPCTD